MSQNAVGNISKDFAKIIEKVSSIVHQISGNRLGEKQAYMIEARVKKRMNELNIPNPLDYITYIDRNLEKESSILVGLITTHHTFFFREFIHFEILKKSLPELVSQVKKRGEKTLKVWSAACSRGPEVYSLAMFLEHHLPLVDPNVTFKILGTDIDNESVKVAINGVYHQNEIKEIPMNFLGNNWARGTGDISLYSKIKASLKTKCEFKTGNLLKVNEVVKGEKFDVIFCRNVFIYFESHQIEQISKDLLSHLYSTGMLFSGISEPLSGIKLEVESVGPSVYMAKLNATSTSLKIAKVGTGIVQVPPAMLRSPAIDIYRVMCVDDSPSILSLMKKILTKEQGFEIVATAINGKDAMDKLKNLKVDLVTLDIHMPEMDGLAYLEKNYNQSHPPVIIISSASRADSDVGMKALRLGASDFIEKPALSNMEERGEEIRTKLRSVVQNYDRKPIVLSSFDKENQKQFVISSPEKKMRVLLASFSDLARLKSFFQGFDQVQPPTYIFFEGHSEMLEAMALEHARDFKYPVAFFSGMEMKVAPNMIYFVDFKTYFSNFAKKHAYSPCSIMAYGNISRHAAKSVSEWKNVQLLLEDLGDKANPSNPLMACASDVVPATSFPYMSCRHLSIK